MAFEGFVDCKGTFFRNLAKHQTREWFQEHKSAFELGWNTPMKELMGDVLALVDDAFPHCDLEPPKVFRIYRDTRFSKDKTPYKTHVGGTLSVKRAGKIPAVPIALYFHVGYNECFGAAGHYMMDPPALSRFRAALVHEKTGRELDAILRVLAKKGCTLGAHESLKRVPKGFDPEHPRAEHLRRKGLIATFPPVPMQLLTSTKLVRHLATQVKMTAPLVEWLVYATA